MVQEAETLISEVLESNSGRACFTCSFQAEDMVVLDLVRKIRPRIAVVFLETGYHFEETYAYRDRIASLWNLNLVNAMPARTVAEQEGEHGKLYRTQPDLCCKLRKVEPLLRSLADYEIWFTGLRREQSPTRAMLKPVETHRLPNGKELLKVSPLAFWTWKDVQSYLTVNEIEVLPLYERGYTSIGCEPCTSIPVDGNARSGRWGGQKLECGIHTFDAARGANE